MSCSKCGHTVSETAEVCAYCGAVVSAGDSSSQSDEASPGKDAQAGETPPSPVDDSPPVLDMTKESTGTSEESEAKSEADSSEPGIPEQTLNEINLPAAEALPGAEDQLSDADDQIDFQLPDEELIVELDTEETAKDLEALGADTGSAEIKDLSMKADSSFDPAAIVDLEQHATEEVAEVIALADKVSAKAASDDSPGLPETPVLEVSGEDPSESETLGADILELVEVDASEPESAPAFTPEPSSKLSDESAGEPKADLAQDASQAEIEDKDGETQALLLTTDDEVQAAPESWTADVEEATPAEEPGDLFQTAAASDEAAPNSDDTSEPGEAQAKADVLQKQTEAQASVEALKIKKSAQELAAAQKKQKAASNAKLLKKKKAALAQAKALKIKKLKLAKAQALKRKKAAMAKARALKNQKEAPAGVENPIKEKAAGSIPSKEDNPAMVIQSMEANTKMLGLLKKYEGQAIGINYDNSAEIKEAELVEANDEFFSVFVKDQELNYSHPLKTILTIIEGPDGVDTGNPEQKEKFKAVVKVYPLVLF
jgi:hypothetical protein